MVTATKEKTKKKEEELIKAGFRVEEIRMKKDLYWHLKIAVAQILPKSYYHYSVKMLFDEQPSKIQLEAANLKLAELKRKKSLFKDLDEEAIEKARDEVKRIEDYIKEMREKCVIIEFLATVEELKYSGSDTNLVVMMPDNVIDALNKMKSLLTFYCIELKPFLPKTV